MFPENTSKSGICKIFILLILFIALIHSAFAFDLYNLRLDIQSQESQSMIAVVSYKLSSSADVISTYEQIENGKANPSFLLPKGTYQFSILADLNSTPTPDYFVEKEILLDQNYTLTMFLEPIGFLQGEVYDNDDNLVENANIKIDCVNPSLFYSLPDKTDEFGGIRATAVHTGQCRILARFQDSTGSEQVDIIKGNLQDVKIVLSKFMVSSPPSRFNPLLIAVVFLVVVFVIWVILSISNKSKSKILPKPSNNFISKSKSAKSKSAPTKHATKPSLLNKSISQSSLNLSPSALAIMNTLSGNEKRAIEAIVLHGGKTTQAKIFHETRIPKSNLFRVIHSLEQKNIIITERFGKVKKVEFAELFSK